MEVNHHSHGTHAVIGGQEMEDFSIANTAQFFTVLSKTLYTNEKLAVVREIICNAWDAHIAAGRQMIPIEITITDNELVIKDTGYGIPHSDMHRRYFVYGLSDKLDDMFQTGGFGLGSKAPFAYSDHFTVVSCHEGTKTIYNLSKASGEKGGKPKPRIISQLPTEETGLTVRVPIKTNHDVQTFTDYTRSIVSMGEINATLNGVPLNVFPISTALKNIYFFNPPSYFKDNLFFIRVGTVVYPIEDNEVYANEFNFLRELFKDILGRYKGSAMLLQGPPGKVSVAPNRESLSMSESTAQIIKDLLMNVILFTDFNRNKGIGGTITKYMDEAFGVLGTKKLISNLTSLNPTQFLQNHLHGKDLLAGNTFDQIVFLFTKNPNPIIVNHIYKHYWRNMLAALSMPFVKWFPRNIFQHSRRRKSKINEFAKTLQKKAFRAGLNPTRIFKQHPNRTGDKRLEPLGEGLRAETLTDFQEIIKCKVVLCHSRQAALRYNKVHSYEYNVIFYVTDRTKEDMDRAIKFFTGIGFPTSDFTEEYNRVYKTGGTGPREKKPKVDDRLLPLMSNLITKNDRVNRRGHIDGPTPELRTDYPAIILMNDVGIKNNFASTVVDWVSWNDSRELIKEFGNQVGIAPTSIKFAKMLETRGKIHGEIYMGEMITKKSQAIPDYMGKLALMKFGKVDGYRNENEKAKRFLKIMGYLPKSISDDIPSADRITAEENKWLTLYIQMLENGGTVGEFRTSPLYKSFQTDREAFVKINSTPTVDTIKELLKRPMLRYLDLDTIMADLAGINRQNSDTIKRQIFLETILLLALTD